MENSSIIVCYPGGAGGCFLARASKAILYDTEFGIDPDLGHCHSGRSSRPVFVAGDTINSFKEELIAIESMDFSSVYNRVVEGHFRNIVALQNRCVQNNVHSWFIKIDVDLTNEREIEFATRMLIAKQTLEVCLKDAYQEIRSPKWPDTYKEYIEQDPNGNLYVESCMSGIRAWYWVETNFTKSRTVTLTLKDLFIGGAGEKLQCWFSPEAIAKFNILHQHYININKQAHESLFKLLD